MQLGARGQAAVSLRRATPVGSGRALLRRVAAGGARAAAAPPRLTCPAPATSTAAEALHQRLRTVAAAQAAGGGSGGRGAGGKASSGRGSKQQAGGGQEAPASRPKRPSSSSSSSSSSSGSSSSGGSSGSSRGGNSSGAAAGGAPKRPRAERQGSGSGSASSNGSDGSSSGGSGSSRGSSSRGSGGHSGGRSGGRSGARPPGFNIKMVNSGLKTADALSELEQLESQYGDRFDYIHVSTAAVRAAHIVEESKGQLPPAAAHPLLRRLAARLEPQLSSCGAWAAANTVWAFGKLQFAEPAPLLSGCLARLASEVATVNSTDVANALYGGALLQAEGYSIDSQQADVLIAALIKQKNAASTDSQHLSNVMWAAATLGKPLPEDTWVQLLAALTAKAALDTSSQHISNTLWAAAKQWGDAPPPRVADALLALAGAVSQQQVAAVPQDVANSLWALATLRLGPQPLTQWLAGAALQWLPGMGPQAISNTALALAKLGLHAPQLFGPLAAAAERQAEQWNFQDTSNFAWAVAVADQRQLAGTVAALVKRLAAAGAMWSSQPSEGFYQLHHVHLWLADWQSVDSGSGLEGLLSSAQAARCAAAWDANLAASAAQRRNDFERRVYAAACRLPCLADCRQEVRTPDGAFNVDVVAIHIASGLALAIEADGPTHFVLPGRSATGETLARNRALAARGYVVVGLPWWQWRDLNNNAEAESAWLQSKVDAAVAAVLAARGAAAAAA